MEDKLAEYRARKAKEKMQSESNTWANMLFGNRNARKRKTEEESGMHGMETSDGRTELKNDRTVPEMTINNPDISMDYHPVNNEASPLTRRETVLYAVKLGLKTVLWLILWALFIEIGFGAVYFVCSTLFIIYRTMRSGSRDRSRLSAYSVFNPNFERLDGTFTAEQFEKELRYGPGAVR